MSNMSNHIDISPYLCQPPRDYRDVLDEQITQLEAETQRITDRLAMLREGREHLDCMIHYR